MSVTQVSMFPISSMSRVLKFFGVLRVLIIYLVPLESSPSRYAPLAALDDSGSLAEFFLHLDI